MRIAVFGGTGRVGRRVIDYALAERHEVIALVRDPSNCGAPVMGLTLRGGDVLESTAVAEVVRGADAVISALGGAGLAAPGQAISGGMRNIVAAVREQGGGRVLAVAGSGVLDAAEGGLRMDAPGFPEIYRAISEEHRGTFDALRASDLDWTLACCPDLVDGARTDHFRQLADQLPLGGASISVQDVASFLLREAWQRQFVRRRVAIAY
ncbi:MAG: NAD(P)H-binding protein [Gemmatimonadota bacterium]